MAYIDGFVIAVPTNHKQKFLNHANEIDPLFLELGVRPGPEVGVLLKKIYERQLDGEVTTLEQGLALAKVYTM